MEVPDLGGCDPREEDGVLRSMSIAGISSDTDSSLGVVAGSSVECALVRVDGIGGRLGFCLV